MSFQIYDLLSDSINEILEYKLLEYKYYVLLQFQSNSNLVFNHL